MIAPAQPRRAASTILLRRTEPTGFEVWLTRRSENLPFLGGVYCFPGGGMDPEDSSPRMIARCSGCSGAEARRIIGAHLRPAEALGFWVAAVRELFEEVGVLLAVKDSGEPFTLRQMEADWAANRRRALLEKSMSFVALLEAEHLQCNLAALTYFSHWQTPAQNPVRFDTHFFLAGLPMEQMPLASAYEVAHGVWLTPDRAIELFEKGELPLIFPTFSSLRTLADFQTLDSVFEEFGRAPAPS